MKNIKAIIFDLGNVLIQWDPRRVFNDKYFESEEKREQFFADICTMDWNEKQDEGRSLVEATHELVEKYPEWESSIRDYYGRWTDMLGGPINGTVEIFKKLKAAGKYKLYALTNWHHGLFDVALVRYNFLQWFDGRVVSGEERTRKPYPAFYQILLDRYNLQADEAVFIDDSLRNIAAAAEIGMKVIHFKSPEQLEAELKNLEII